jgi:hypothetical protein
LHQIEKDLAKLALTNSAALSEFRDIVRWHWLRALRRRGQRDKTTWADINRLAIAGYRRHAFFIHGRVSASPSNIQGGSRMWEFRPYGSVRGAL